MKCLFEKEKNSNKKVESRELQQGCRMLLDIDFILCVEEDAVVALRQQLPDLDEGDFVIFPSSAGPRSLQLVIAAAAEAKERKCQAQLRPTFARIGMRARYAVIVLDERSIVAIASRSMSDSWIFRVLVGCRGCAVRGHAAAGKWQRPEWNGGESMGHNRIRGSVVALCRG